MERFWKAHGLGNDYLVWESAFTSDNEMSAKRVVQICDRYRGLGSDGILEPWTSPVADIGVRIWNPDGSIAEKSGNGIRIFAWWWAVVQDKVERLHRFTVDTGTEIVSCVVYRDTGTVDVAMGPARFEPSEIPTVELVWGREIPIAENVKLVAYTMGIGNPHCAIFVEDMTWLDQQPWQEWGAFLEHHPLFPNRINVQFAQVIDPRTIEIRIWERGAGETQASGSSSCAVASIAHKLGKVEASVEMKMPGGVLSVEIQSDWQVRLCGPVEAVAMMLTEL